VLHPGGFASEEAAAQAINSTDWQPMAGMAKKRCEGIAKLIVMKVCAGDGRAIVRHHFACWTQVSCRQIRKALVRTPR
jgi:hypothetical protein